METQSLEYRIPTCSEVGVDGALARRYCNVFASCCGALRGVSSRTIASTTGFRLGFCVFLGRAPKRRGAVSLRSNRTGGRPFLWHQVSARRHET